MYYKLPKNLKVRAYVKNYDEIVKDRDLEIIQLQQRIDKAKEYLKHIDDFDIKDFVREDILEILGDKE